MIFSVIHTCPWFLNNTFQVPENMPACPNGRCICGFFWIHNVCRGLLLICLVKLIVFPSAGFWIRTEYELMQSCFPKLSDDGFAVYMNGFQCNITGNVGTQPIGKPGLARQCGADAASGHPANPSNCTIGPKNPMYWDQTEQNNVCTPC